MRLKCTSGKKELKREEYVTGLLEVTVTEGYLMEVDASREPCDFAMFVTSSRISSTSGNTWVVTALQIISTLSFIVVYMFALVIPYLFAVCFVSP